MSRVQKRGAAKIARSRQRAPAKRGAAAIQGQQRMNDGAAKDLAGPSTIGYKSGVPLLLEVESTIDAEILSLLGKR